MDFVLGTIGGTHCPLRGGGMTQLSRDKCLRNQKRHFRKRSINPIYFR